jgi:hypothetical protein
MNVRDAFAAELADFIADPGWADLPLAERKLALENAARQLGIEIWNALPSETPAPLWQQEARERNGFPRLAPRGAR